MIQKVNKSAVARAFNRAAESYERYADFQRLSGERLMALLPSLSSQRILDAGCGTGWFSRLWKEKGYQVIALDLSFGMLIQARRGRSAQYYLLGDIEAIPLQKYSVDITWSNLAVQWCSNLTQVIRELHRVTRPGGKVLFSTLADASMHEMRIAWEALDTYQHVNPFLSESAIRMACDGLLSYLESEMITQYFTDVFSILQSIKGIGATHIHQGRARGLLTRRHLIRLQQKWPKDSKGYRLSYQLITGIIECE